jgi:hypothetical protein
MRGVWLLSYTHAHCCSLTHTHTAIHTHADTCVPPLCLTLPVSTSLLPMSMVMQTERRSDHPRCSV